jgi:hypothetical protein
VKVDAAFIYDDKKIAVEIETGTNNIEQIKIRLLSLMQILIIGFLYAQEITSRNIIYLLMALS